MGERIKGEQRMNRTVGKNKTLLVEGPASVTLCSGRVDVFGFELTPTNKVVIREGKRLPLLVQEESVLDVSIGDKAAAEEVDGCTIPSSWVESATQLLDLGRRPATVIVLGTIDSGKSSFCTYVVNRILADKKKVAVLDGDLGQSDIGPPSTIAYAIVSKPLTDLFGLKARSARFLGETSPSNVTEEVIRNLSSLKKEIISSDLDFLVVNTDGWTEGDCAVNYKLRLVEELSPDLVFCIQQQNEMAPIVSGLGKFRAISVESPSAIRQRDKDKRKSLRELGYKKYLPAPRVQSLSLSWIKVEGDESFGLGKGRALTREAKRVNEMLGMKPLHVAELTDRINIIIGKGRWINEETIRRVQEQAKKRIVVTRKGEEEGLLAGMYDAGGKFLGIGVLQEIDYLRKTVKVVSSVSGEVSTLVLGKIRLDKNMKEVPSFEESNLDFGSISKLF
jgi:polynucleotide 5'-hydroxyl-kinase GRC3/NOL9